MPQFLGGCPLVQPVGISQAAADGLYVRKNTLQTAPNTDIARFGFAAPNTGYVNVDTSAIANGIAWDILNNNGTTRVQLRLSLTELRFGTFSAFPFDLVANSRPKWRILADAAGLASLESQETAGQIQAPSGRLDLQKDSGGPVRLGATSGAGALLELGREQPVFGASITPAGTSNGIRITANSATAPTINAPTANPSQPGALVLILIRNASGGAMGAVTFNAIYKLAGFAAPANGQSTSALVFWDGSNYVQCSPWTAAIPN